MTNMTHVEWAFIIGCVLFYIYCFHLPESKDSYEDILDKEVGDE